MLALLQFVDHHDKFSLLIKASRLCSHGFVTHLRRWVKATLFCMGSCKLNGFSWVVFQG
jgi:hypothetical protein